MESSYQNGPNKPEYLSREGFDKLKAELTSLRTEARKDIAERLEYAKSLGDLSENSEYHDAKEAKEVCEARIAELENILARAKIISKSANTDEISVGSTVVALKKGSDSPMKFVLVGSEEASPSTQRISYESPLGKAFLGRKRNEVVSVSTPGGVVEYIISDIL